MIALNRKTLRLLPLLALLVLPACSGLGGPEPEFVLYDRNLEVADFANSPYNFITK